MGYTPNLEIFCITGLCSCLSFLHSILCCSVIVMAIPTGGRLKVCDVGWTVSSLAPRPCRSKGKTTWPGNETRLYPNATDGAIHCISLQIDYQHATASFLGWVVAAYSFGQLVASPLFGLWGDYRPTREPLLISLVINVIFSLLYSFAGAFPAGVAGWILIVARCMVGFGAGQH